MLWRKRALWAISIGVFLLIAGSFFPAILGVIAKVYVRLDKGWELQYKTVTWKEGNFVFSDLLLKDATRAFSISANALHISLNPKIITIDQPVVKITNIPSFDNSSNAWSFFITNGLLEIENLPQGN